MLKNLTRDILASFVVLLVALPLCLGIANACGLPPVLGLITGIVGGLIVGVLAGCPLQVSGPAAGLVVTVAEVVKDERLGIQMLGTIVMAAGLIQILAGLLRLGQWFRAVSPAVVEGMLAGIGVLIFASQFHVMVDDSPRNTGIANLMSIPESLFLGFSPNPHTVHDEAAIIGVLTIIVLVGWRFVATRHLRVIPAPLVAILVTATATWLLDWPITRVSIPPPNQLLEGLQFPTIEKLSRLGETPVWLAVFTISFIASAETLLCASAVDIMQNGPRTQYDRELFAQGIGNMVCGFLGSLPMTGVIVRSSANIDAGAKTRLSAILHGLWLLITVLFLYSILNQIPLSALAAILVYMGFRLVNLLSIRELARWGWGEVIIYLATMIGVVTLNLLEGVVLGIVLAMVKLLWRFTRLVITEETDPKNNRTVLKIEGAATFLKLPLLANTLERISPETELHVRFEKLTYIDHACLELLMNWEKQYKSKGGSLILDWNTLHARFHEETLEKQVEGESELTQ